MYFLIPLIIKKGENLVRKPRLARILILLHCILACLLLHYMFSLAYTNSAQCCPVGTLIYPPHFVM